MGHSKKIKPWKPLYKEDLFKFGGHEKVFWGNDVSAELWKMNTIN